MTDPAVRRVAIVGTESTGKSALAAGLAERFGEPWAPEFVRAFWEEQQGRIVAADLPTIARGQMANEENAVLAARRVVFCDTTLLMNVRWADDLYGGDIPGWMREEADAQVVRYEAYLYCAPDLPWEPDPQRVFADPVAWQASAERVRGMLDERKLDYAVISGRGAERLERALAALAERGLRPE